MDKVAHAHGIVGGKKSLQLISCIISIAPTMALERVKKTEIIDKFRTHEGDTGSAEVQVAILSARIGELTGHFDTHAKDHASRRGLLKMVSRRRKLLSYLRKHNEESYKGLIKELGIRK